MSRSFDNAGLTEGQKQKVTELAETTRQTMLRANPDDWRARQDLASQLRKSIEQEVLTPEQRQKRVDERREQANRWFNSLVEWTVKSFDRAGLTDEQKQKATELAQAVREAGGKLDGEDWRGRTELTGQLRKDIEPLLTDEQKKKVGEGAGYQYWVQPGGQRIMVQPGEQSVIVVPGRRTGRETPGE